MHTKVKTKSLQYYQHNKLHKISYSTKLHKHKQKENKQNAISAYIQLR